MKNNFNDCVTRLLRDEGGYTNDPRDPGGPTNFGITLKDYRLYINKNGTAEDVKNMSQAQARQIYRAKYWDVLGCDSLSSGVDYTVFDYGVNSGVGRPRKVLQRFKSLQGTELIDAINDERLSFLQSLATFKTFGRGWTTRVTGVRAYSKVLAKTNNAPGTIVGAGGIGVTAWLSQFWQQHEILIIVCGLTLAIVAATAVHLYKNKGK